MATKTGTVKWFSLDKGFGFIVQDDGGKDLFAHISEIAADSKTLMENQRVEYGVRQGPKGLQATGIRPV